MAEYQGANASPGTSSTDRLMTAGLLALMSVTALVSAGISGYNGYLAKSLGLVQRERPSMHFTMDTGRLKLCPGNGSAVAYASLPCMKSVTEYYSKNGNLGPIICHDECNFESMMMHGGGGGGVGRGNGGGRCDATRRCRANSDTFELSEGSSNVRIWKDGVYRIYAQVTFQDAEPSPTVIGLQVNERHAWVLCHQSADTSIAAPVAYYSSASSSKPSVSSAKAPTSVCSLTSLRRFRSGDLLSVSLPEAFRTLNVSPLITFWGLVRLAD